MWLNNRKNQSSWRKYRQSAQWQISDHRLQEHFVEIQTHVSLSLPWGNLHVCGLAFQTFEFLLYWSVRRPKFWRSMALSFILSAKLAICCGGGICNIKSIRTQNVTPLPLAASSSTTHLPAEVCGSGVWGQRVCRPGRWSAGWVGVPWAKVYCLSPPGSSPSPTAPRKHEPCIRYDT